MARINLWALHNDLNEKLISATNALEDFSWEVSLIKN